MDQPKKRKKPNNCYVFLSHCRRCCGRYYGVLILILIWVLFLGLQHHILVLSPSFEEGGGGGGDHPMKQALEQQKKLPPPRNLPFIPPALSKNGITKRNKNDDDSTFSACLLIMDENHFLVEWLAYHYTILPLRYVIVATDQRSETSPTTILNKWRQQNMTIIEWKDVDFLPPHWLNRIPAEDDPTALLMKHRERQRHFYPACFEFLKQAGRTWTTVIDVDEFLLFNQHYYPGSVQEQNQQQQQSPLVRDPLKLDTIIQGILDQDTFQNASCFTIPRLRFGNYENRTMALSSGADAIFNKNNVPFLPFLRRQDFLTYRWFYRAGWQDKSFNRLPKSLIQVQRVSNFSRDDTDAHRPVRSACPRRNLYTKVWQSPWVVHHYIGSPEQFQYAHRHGTKTRNNQEQLDAYQTLWAKYDNSIVGWLEQFVHAMGDNLTMVKTLLQGVGNVSYPHHQDS